MKSGVIRRNAEGKLVLVEVEGDANSGNDPSRSKNSNNRSRAYNPGAGSVTYRSPSAANTSPDSAVKATRPLVQAVLPAARSASDYAPALRATIEDMQAGEWRQVPEANSFFDVALSKNEHQALLDQYGGHDIWGWGGPKQIFHEWNSTAYDSQGGRFLFSGGGHAGYGGNEVYQFSLEDLRWSRLSDPTPLTDQFDPVERPKFWRPGDRDGDGFPDGPNASHNYDGILWNPATASLWLFEQRTSFPMNRPPETFLVWEFDESRSRWVPYPVDEEFSFASSTYLAPLGKTLLINHRYSYGDFASLFDSSGRQTQLGQVQGDRMAGESGMMFSHPVTHDVYQAERDSIFRLDVSEGSASATKIADYPDIESIGYTTPWHQAGFAFRDVDEEIYIWNGDRDVIRLNPSSGVFERLMNEQARSAYPAAIKGRGKIFGKWVYLAGLDVFLGISSPQSDQGGGWWIYKPGSNAADITRLKLGSAKVDARTTESIGIFLPVVNGDSNFNGQVGVQYRRSGTTQWSDAMDLMRLRPGLVTVAHDFDKSPAGFAGSLFGLAAGTDYEIRLSAKDPDGMREGSAAAIQVIPASTRRIPRRKPTSPREVPVSSDSELTAALNAAEPGDVISLARGDYQTSILKASGTKADPIIITGDGTFVAASGESHALRIDGDHVQVRGLKFKGAGIRLVKPTSGVVLRNNRFVDVPVGIDAKGGHHNLYIVDNELQGQVIFPDTSKAVRRSRGIVVTGQDVEVAYNTLSGFGDSLSMSSRSARNNIGVHFHNNLITDSGDDGIELDFSLRNTAAYENLIANCFKGISFQPVYGGPAYAFRNVIYNSARGPIKINPESDDSHGMIVVHNTMIKAGEAWLDFSGRTSLAFIVNNIFVGQNGGERAVHNMDEFVLSTIDYNLWANDGAFILNGVSGSSFASYQAKADFSQHSDVANSARIFARLQPDFDLNDATIYRDPAVDVSLAPNSRAVNAGLYLPNLSAQNPDMGAVELGSSPPHYGVRK